MLGIGIMCILLPNVNVYLWFRPLMHFSCSVCISADCILVCSVIYYDYNNDTLNNSDH